MARDREARPNVLLVCTDQQRWDTIGRLGLRDVQTPAMDTLASDGVMFTDAYTASPVCAPARASMITGTYPSVHGLYANGVRLPERPMFTKLLADSGYRTGLVGKLHLSAAWQGRAEQRGDDGLDYYRWAHDPRHPSPDNDYHRWLEAEFPELWERAHQPATAHRLDREAVAFDLMPTEAHYSRWVSTRTTEFIEQRATDGRPFFCWVNYFDPHHPFVAPEEYLDPYRNAAVPLGCDPEELPILPAGLAGMREYANAAGARAFADYTADELRELVRAYYAMTTHVDDEIGRVLRRLDELGLADNTLVLLTSDHGEMLTDHGLLLKGPALYEGAVRVPLVLRWPDRLPAGQRRTALAQPVDLAATILDAAGLAAGSWGDGHSLLPTAVEGDARWPRPWALCQYRDSGRPDDPPAYSTMLREGRWKLVVLHGAPTTVRPRELQLFDLEADPHELHDRSADSDCAAVLIDLLGRLTDVEVALERRDAERVAPW